MGSLSKILSRDNIRLVSGESAVSMLLTSLYSFLGFSVLESKIEIEQGSRVNPKTEARSAIEH